MANIMLMPKLGLTMVEGKIGKWFKNEGDTVTMDEPLLQVETDKMVNKVNATFEGTLLKILVPRGDKQEVKLPICIIGQPGEDISALLNESGSDEVKAVEEKPVAKKATSNANVMLMPKLGLTMVEGKIGKWFKNEGDTVTMDEPLLQVETDKMVNKVNATFEGTLLKILVPRGDKQAVKLPICIIGQPGDDISSLLGESEDEVEVVEEAAVAVAEVKSVGAAGDVVLATPLAKKVAREKGYDISAINGTGPNGRIVEKDVLAYSAGPKTSPTAKVLADKLGVDLSKINKTTRVMKEDVLSAASKNARFAGVNPVEERVEMTTMRRVISERMTASWLTSPAVTYDLKVDTTMLKAFKDQIKLSQKVTYTDLIAKIAATVLLEFPLLNSSIDGDELILRNYVNLGVAVALDEGLIVPVVKYANTMGLKELSKEIKTLAVKAKNNELDGEDLQGGTFTITNLGMYQMDSFSPIINQPEVAILGITAIKDTVVAKNGEIVILPMMNLCLTADHRAVDGAVAAQFMARLKEVMENPALLLL